MLKLRTCTVKEAHSFSFLIQSKPWKDLVCMLGVFLAPQLCIVKRSLKKKLARWWSSWILNSKFSLKSCSPFRQEMEPPLQRAGWGRGFNSHPVHFYRSGKIRYWTEFGFNKCRAHSAAMPIELYLTLQGDLHTSQTLQEALRDIYIVASSIFWVQLPLNWPLLFQYFLQHVRAHRAIPSDRVWGRHLRFYHLGR